MAEAVSPKQQIEALRRELAERDAIIAASQAERADAALLKARLTTALLEIERIKLQLWVNAGIRPKEVWEELERREWISRLAGGVDAPLKQLLGGVNGGTTKIP